METPYTGPHPSDPLKSWPQHFGLFGEDRPDSPLVNQQTSMVGDDSPSVGDIDLEDVDIAASLMGQTMIEDSASVGALDIEGIVSDYQNSNHT